MARIETVVEFKHGIPCKKEVLGLEYSVKIGSNNGIIAFPNIPLNYLDEFNFDKGRASNLELVHPTNSDLKLFSVKDAEWGKFYDNTGNSIVKHCSIWFPCSYEKHEEVAIGLGKLTENYINRLILFIEILTQHALGKKTYNTIEVESMIQYWILGNDKCFKNAENISISVHVHHLPQEVFLSKKLINQAIEYTNKEKKPNYSLVLLRDAISHQNDQDFRRTILDATTAIEIAFTNRIIKEFIKQGIEESDFRNSILKKFHSLSGRVELLESLKIKLPIPKKTYKEFLSNIRNRAIHAGYNPSKEETSKVISLTIDTLNSFCEIVED